MMLVHSSTHYTEANEISGVKDEYQKLFKDLFPQNYKSIMLLHKLVSIGSAKISKIFLSKSKETQAEEDKENILMYDTYIEELIVRNMCLDKNNLEWISALTRTSAKEISGLDYICEWYDVSKTKRNVYKAILTNEEIYIKPLFESISNGINYEITDSIWSILKGDFNAVGDIIIKQIHNYAKDNKDFIITNDEKEKDESNWENKLKELLKTLFLIIKGNYFKLDLLEQVLINADIDREFACYVFGFNSIINYDEDNIFYLFKSNILLKDINDLSLIEAIYDLIKYGPKCLNKHLKTIFVKHCEGNKLYSTALES